MRCATRTALALRFWGSRTYASGLSTCHSPRTGGFRSEFSKRPTTIPFVAVNQTPEDLPVEHPCLSDRAHNFDLQKPQRVRFCQTTFEKDIFNGLQLGMRDQTVSPETRKLGQRKSPTENSYGFPIFKHRLEFIAFFEVHCYHTENSMKLRLYECRRVFPDCLEQLIVQPRK